MIGVDRVPPLADSPAAAILEDFFVFDSNTQDVAAQIRRVTGNCGVDVVYDAVGGVTTGASLAALAPGGRLVAISAVGTRSVEIDLIDFYRNESRLLGVNSGKLDVVESGRLLAELTPHFESGEFRPLPISHSYRLDEGQDAYLAVAGGVAGRVVIRP